MKRFLRKSSLAMLVVASVLLAGCGNSLSKLTAEEEEMFVAYSSSVVAKANQNQSQGLTYLAKEVPEEVPKEEASTEDDLPEQASPSNPTESQPTEEPADANETDTAAANTNATNAATTTDTPKTTLTKALGIAKIKAQFQGYEVGDYYMEGNAASLNATSGNTFVILKIKLTNTSQKSVNCNIVGSLESSQLILNGVPAASAVQTILNSDFAQYNMNMEGGTSSNTVLIFQVGQKIASEIETLSLICNIEGKEYHIELENKGEI
jgi:hypothetical protein